MLLLDQHPHNKSLMASVLGAPNVGKSTMINALLGMPLSVVTNRPQTTRNKFKCIFTIGRSEIILVDTPGIHSSGQELNKRMNAQAREGSDGADINFLLIDLTQEVMRQFSEFKRVYENELGPTWVVFTKADLVEEAESLPLAEVVEKAKELFPNIEQYFVLSSKTGDGLAKLSETLEKKAIPGPHLFPGGDISDRNERFFVSEYIREQTFHLLKDELPYEMAVVIDEYKDMKEKEGAGKPKILSHISATILVNRPSQRAIVIGTKGSMIKEIGTRSRVRIEELVGGQVHLNLHVKVSPKWFKNNMVLEELGLPRAHDSARVWRAKS
jgi:GTP-binding protein Era